MGGDGNGDIRQDTGHTLASVAAGDERVNLGLVVVEDGGSERGNRAESKGGEDSDGLEGEHFELAWKECEELIS